MDANALQEEEKEEADEEKADEEEEKSEEADEDADEEEEEEDEDEDDDVCWFEKSRILTSRSLRTYVIASDQEQDTYHEMPHLALLTYCADHARHLRGVREVVGLRQRPASLRGVPGARYWRQGLPPRGLH